MLTWRTGADEIYCFMPLRNSRLVLSVRSFDFSGSSSFDYNILAIPSDLVVISPQLSNESEVQFCRPNHFIKPSRHFDLSEVRALTYPSTFSAKLWPGFITKSR